MNFSHNPKVIKFLTLHTFSKYLPTHIFLKIIVALFGNKFQQRRLIPMLKIALNMIEEVSNPYLLINPLITVTEYKNDQKIA